MNTHTFTNHSQRPAATPGAAENWEKFAQDDPYHYILTSLKSSDATEFWCSGERTVHREFLPLLELHDVTPLVCLELGCGIGRLSVPLARHFQQALGVDISPSMVRRAQSFARDNGIHNVSFTSITGPEDFLCQFHSHFGKCDFIYSLLVFQHIADFSIIAGYLHVIRALLHRHGLAYLQFDTRPQNLAYRFKTRLPDCLLPHHWRRGIRRIRRSADQIDAAIRSAGLEVVGELTPHTAYHRYTLRVAQTATQGSL
jgi:cyclopropane fatty-acyl-phospholipid synthase-like methyltransferase